MEMLRIQMGRGVLLVADATWPLVDWQTHEQQQMTQCSKSSVKALMS